ncbi:MULTISPECIES: class I SAM-dependent methyltransferase [Halomonadaceae]|uniref:class I SAM-dependent methyltransferase n=1 Tax=Halomonadaceae TaxID=28256 RepID=UPI00159842C2|nr:MULTISPECIES: rRNA adenine N-6-methyltransferase family protein [Halomonas]QJQ96152.1 methyltransferase [Halomonas sp. PA5]
MNIQENTSRTRTVSQRQQLSLFARNFFKHPRMLGSIIPSSPFLVRRLLDQADWERARVLVEYGPGVGTISREILSRMHPEARLVVVETNEDFVNFLHESIPDPRLLVVHGSAEDIKAILAEHNLDGADHVIAGIPFSTMPDALRRGVLQATQEALNPTGSMLIYQFSPKVHSDLQQVFSNVRKGFEPLNIPPAQVYFCTP